MIGCVTPQIRFWIAIASVKSATEIPKSVVTGFIKRPQLCRMPMLIVNMMLDPTNTEIVWALVKAAWLLWLVICMELTRVLLIAQTKLVRDFVQLCVR